ncbi:hypothetical protein [Longimicrobium sp.]|uniref:hypothetical protein n=1 Tax=Longimicrobium sp. TaxID=2029185 RepID=UPI002C1C2FCC|nr:hypothetical protein [Longimicrobium sp.]HSU15310.1 hypothetical protein [Longimicrobium sp.]
MPVRGIRRAFVLLGCAAALAACSSDSTFPAEASGSFKLTSVNGNALPFQLPGLPAGTSARLEAGSLVILDNGRFTETLQYFLVTPDKPQGAPSTAITVGDASGGGGSITFEPRFEDSWNASYTATTVTYSRQANSNVTLSFVFTRNN